MSIWRTNDPGRFSAVAMSDIDGNGTYPNELPHRNPDIEHISHMLPGILNVRSRHDDGTTLVLTGGMHGDEKAGIVILDRLVHELCEGEVPVKRNLLLMYGNLRAMQAEGGKGLRCIESEVGATSNLNRCFNYGTFEHPKCYAERRANQMVECAEAVLQGRRVEAIDIHQSFGVPTLADIRQGGDRTEYTYAMLYPRDISDTLSWVHHYFSDIVAGAVLNNMSKVHRTWAGYMASRFGAHTATFEQGTIGHTDHVTFTPQLYDNLVLSVGGEGRLQNPQGFDVWKCQRGIIRTSENFTFLDAAGQPLQRAPQDFVSISYRTVARDGTTAHMIDEDERLLFANAEVPIGDRAAEIIARMKTDLVPSP